MPRNQEDEPNIHAPPALDGDVFGDDGEIVHNRFLAAEALGNDIPVRPPIKFRAKYPELDDFAKERYLLFVRRYGRLQQAAAFIQIPHKYIMEEMERDPPFKEAFEHARGLFLDSIEQEIARRGMDGWREPVYQMGMLVGYVTKYSDKMLELYAKKHDASYREKGQLDVNVAGGIMVIPQAPTSADAWEKAAINAEFSDVVDEAIKAEAEQIMLAQQQHEEDDDGREN